MNQGATEALLTNVLVAEHIVYLPSTLTLSCCQSSPVLLVMTAKMPVRNALYISWFLGQHPSPLQSDERLLFLYSFQSSGRQTLLSAED